MNPVHTLFTVPVTTGTFDECSCCRYSGFLHSIFILNECAVSRVYTRVNKENAEKV